MRWKLMVAHYLNVPGEEWEYVENDRKTGRPVRQKFKVPRLLDPADPQCWTNRWGNKDNEEGEVMVCHEGKGESNDHVFFGDPTPDMVPIDDEAKALSKSFEERWKYKPTEAAQSFSQSMVDQMQIKLAEASTKPAQVEGLDKLTDVLGKIVEQNAALMSKMAAQPERRI